MPDSGLRELEEHNQQLKRLVELSVTLNSTLDPEALLQTIIRTAGELLDCEAASILLYDEKHPHLYFAAATGSDPQKLAEVPVPIEGSLAGTIFRTKRALVLNNAEQDPRHYSLVSEHIRFQVRTLLGVPMHLQERVIGVLEAVNKRQGAFTARDETILSVIASHAAITINNANLMQALQRAFERVKEADRLKSNFLALASHELRTPLGIIIGYASFLREEAKGALSDHAKRVLEAALQMRSLVEDMTNLTMLESEGKLQVKTQPLAVEAMLRTACDEVRAIAAAKEQQLVVALPEHALMVRADTEKLASALVNVLNNAVRFSPQGSEILVSAAEGDDGVLISVRDQGIGIRPDQLDKIFQQFYQVEQPNVRRYGGLGIGLSIARGLIEAQDGRIWAESEGPGNGTVFKIWLPTIEKE